MNRRNPTHRLPLQRLALLLALGLLLTAPVQADPPPRVQAQARMLRSQMVRRGEERGEIDLALAWHYARARQARSALYFVKQARKHGVAAGRTDLLLGTFYRRSGRYDAAFSTLVRVLVRNPQQPYALVQLWKTLYEAKLRGAATKTDTVAIQQRLAGLGLHFPVTFDPAKVSPDKSKQLAAAGYNALLSDKSGFAAELFESAVEANPSNALAHRGLGIARARKHDYTRAAGAYLLYLELNPQAPDADEVDRVLMEHWKNRVD